MKFWWRCSVPIFMIWFKWWKRKHTGLRLKNIHTCHMRGWGGYICYIRLRWNNILFSRTWVDSGIRLIDYQTPPFPNVVAFPSGEHIDGMFVHVCWCCAVRGSIRNRSIYVVRNGMKWNNNKWNFNNLFLFRINSMSNNHNLFSSHGISLQNKDEIFMNNIETSREYILIS